MISIFKKKIKERKGKIEFSINDNTYIINSFTISAYYEVSRPAALPSAVKKATEDTIANKARIISILSGCPSTLLLQLELNQFESLYSLVKKYYLDYQSDLEPRKTIVINKKDYHLIDLKTITTGEFSDIDILAKMENTLHKQVAILYGAKEEEYEEFLQLDIRDIMGCINFFLTSTRKSLNNFLLFMEMKANKDTKALIRQVRVLISKQHKHGTNLSYSSQEMIVSELMKLSNSLLEKHSITSPTVKREIEK